MSKGDFFDQVYEQVLRIPAGKVTSYGAISELISGRKSAARTVGWALNALKGEQAEIVPWWRVINAQGRISNSSREHSAEVQRLLLEAEGIEFRADDRVDMERFGWP